MGTVRGGNVYCDKCGAECKVLYGFAMSVDRVAHTHNDKIKDIVEKIDKKYGQHDFIICWDCTIQMMGIQSLDQKHAAMMRSKKVGKRQETVELSNTETGSFISGTKSDSGVRGDRCEEGVVLAHEKPFVSSVQEPIETASTSGVEEGVDNAESTAQETE